MDEIRCKKCGLWLERPDSICPRCIAIDGSEEEKRKFYENMDEHSIENAHISSIKKVAETLLRDGQHYTIDPREIINLINMLEYARATQIPPDSGAIRELGSRLVDLLDEDDWNNLEPFLLKAKGAQIELEAEITRLTAEVERLKGEVQQLCLDASPPPDPQKSIKLVSGVQGKSGGVHQPRKQASPEAAPDAVGFPPDTDITDCDLIAALRAEVERLTKLCAASVDNGDAIMRELSTAIETAVSMKARAEQAEKELAECRAKVENEKRQTAEVERWYRSADAERIEQQTRAMQAEAALRELYTYPGVRDLLAPTDSLGSIARRVEDVLK